MHWEDIRQTHLLPKALYNGLLLLWQSKMTSTAYLAVLHLLLLLLHGGLLLC